MVCCLVLILETANDMSTSLSLPDFPIDRLKEGRSRVYNELATVVGTHPSAAVASLFVRVASADEGTMAFKRP
jgi:hypothetical protein